MSSEQATNKNQDAPLNSNKYTIHKSKSKLEHVSNGI